MKKILLSLASLLIAGGAWAQQYSLTEFEVTTDESQPKTYVMESLRKGYGFPELWYDSSENKVKTMQGGAYSATPENNHFLWYFTDAGDGKYYIHPYGAQSGYVLGAAEEIANDVEVIAVEKTAATAIKWTLGTSENYPCFSVASGEQTFYLHDYFDDSTKRSDKFVLKAVTSGDNFRGYTFTFGKFDPIITTAKDDLSNLINSFDYKIAYQCLGTEIGQFVDTDNAYKTAYDAAQAAITAGTGDFETLLANVQNAFDALEYKALPTEKFYTFKSKSTSKYLAPNAPGSAMKMSDDIAVFELTAETWMEMCANGLWINGVNHGRGGKFHNTNKFYRVADGSFIIAATPTDATAHAILKAGDANLTSVADDAIDDACYWVVEEYAVPAVTVDATNKYATFYAPAAVAVPEGVVAYYVSEVNGKSATLTEIETNIPANTGAILYAEGDKECNFTVVSYNGEDAVSGNLLVGTQSKTTVTKEEGSSYYILANVDGVVGFYKAVNATDEATFVNAAGKAYLKVANDAAGARFLSFNFGGTETAIKNIEGAESNSVVYDLSGRRVQNVTKGLYIVNGKKVVK